MKNPQCLTESVREIKQNVLKILPHLNESSARDTKSSKDVKNKILAIATVKNLEEKTGKEYSDDETLLIAQRRAWDLEDEDRRNLFLSREITYMPDCQKFPNGKENIACPCKATERMKDENTIWLTLNINGRNMGVSEDIDITITLELKSPITSSYIVESLRDRRMDEIKRNSSCSIHVEPITAERAFYRSFGGQEVEAVR